MSSSTHTYQDPSLEDLSIEDLSIEQFINQKEIRFIKL